MKGSHPRPADGAHLYLNIACQVTSFMQLGMLWYQLYGIRQLNNILLCHTALKEMARLQLSRGIFDTARNVKKIMYI